MKVTPKNYYYRNGDLYKRDDFYPRWVIEEMEKKGQVFPDLYTKERNGDLVLYIPSGYVRVGDKSIKEDDWNGVFPDSGYLDIEGVPQPRPVIKNPKKITLHQDANYVKLQSTLLESLALRAIDQIRNVHHLTPTEVSNLLKSGVTIAQELRKVQEQAGERGNQIIIQGDVDLKDSLEIIDSTLKEIEFKEQNESNK